MTGVIDPGRTLGILGGGQLGRMLALAAARFGYRVHVLADAADSPAGQVAAREFVAGCYGDLEAVTAFAKTVDMVTYEFENVPSAAIETAARFAPVHPNAELLHASQNREREKLALSRLGIPVAPFHVVHTADDLAEGLRQIGTPAILKTSESGYDGKGQVRIDDPAHAEAAWTTIGNQPAVLEGVVAFERELSVIACRDRHGGFAAFGPIENTHADHILDVSVCPANVDERTATEAVAIARTIVEAFDVIGVLCVEFFHADDGRLLVNEIAPRPHNSGHLTIDAHRTSQFEQQLRAVCGHRLGSVEPPSPAAMANLLGNLWEPGPPNWSAAIDDRRVRLHLYGKSAPRIGRKMGHLTALAENGRSAVERARSCRAALVVDASVS